MKISTIPASRLTSDHLEAWSRLQRGDAALDSPFLRPEFALAVAAVRDDVEVLVLEEGGRHLGFLPLHRSRRNVGRPLADVMSDLHGLVVAKGVECTGEQLLRGAGLVAWHFDHLIASQEIFRPYHGRLDDSPYMDLSNGFEEYAQSRRLAGSKVIVRASRKSRKIARELGPLRFERHSNDPACLSAMIRWKQAQLRRRYCPDVFRLPWVVPLLGRTCDTRTEGFSGMLSALYAGDHLLAVHLGLRSHAVLASWIPAFDPVHSKYSPGLVLHVALAAEAANCGIRRIDLGRGYNRTKSSLMSGALPMALGAVDRRPLCRMLRSGWYRAGNLVRTTPLNEPARRAYHRLRSLITAEKPYCGYLTSQPKRSFKDVP